ncbi:hypothetical protein [Pseudotenacibaculum haliotis]|uniref:Uncharacterized protein n=1 Tax=Pseudotenacibaculum haliotis TaxID=1862138 RepID=A0ABW5LQX8_9FLAO
MKKLFLDSFKERTESIISRKLLNLTIGGAMNGTCLNGTKGCVVDHNYVPVLPPGQEQEDEDCIV